MPNIYYIIRDQFTGQTWHCPTSYEGEAMLLRLRSMGGYNRYTVIIEKIGLTEEEKERMLIDEKRVHRDDEIKRLIND